MGRSCHPCLGEQQEPREAGNAAGSLPARLPADAGFSCAAWQASGTGRELLCLGPPPAPPSAVVWALTQLGRARHHKPSASLGGCQDMAGFGITALAADAAKLTDPGAESSTRQWVRHSGPCMGHGLSMGLQP